MIILRLMTLNLKTIKKFFYFIFQAQTYDMQKMITPRFLKL